VSAFERGRQFKQQAAIARQEQAAQIDPMRPVILVIAVDKKTKSQRIVGTAYSSRGVGELIARLRSEYAGCEFSSVDTVLVQR